MATADCLIINVCCNDSSAYLYADMILISIKNASAHLKTCRPTSIFCIYVCE